MAFALRIWKLRSKRTRCSTCRQHIRLVFDDQARSLPFELTATPIGESEDARGIVFDVFDPETAFHRCLVKQTSTAKPDAYQERFL